jgi:hypothetical protein
MGTRLTNTTVAQDEVVREFPHPEERPAGPRLESRRTAPAL